ncbi:unnamed protein product [Arabidopsis halleri]
MNSCSFPLFIFVVVLIFFRSLSSTGAAPCHPDDEAGLLAFKSGITQDPLDILSSWKKGTDCCSWYGISCLPVNPDNRVTILAVDGNTYAGETFLSGTISPLLAKLQHLNETRLTDLRKITGSFPQFLFKLPKLNIVYLENNRPSGPLPANIDALSKLEIFSLEGNRFTVRSQVRYLILLDYSNSNSTITAFLASSLIYSNPCDNSIISISPETESLGNFLHRLHLLHQLFGVLRWVRTIYRGLSQTIYRDSSISCH